MRKNLLIFAVFVLGGGGLFAEGPARAVIPVDLNDSLPYGEKPIDYFGKDTQNAVETLNRQLDRGEVKFPPDEGTGYLRSLLKALDIPPESQMLVFSRTALNPKLVSPKNPRAVYFNEDCYVGWVPGAAALEVAAIDPQKGWMFYTLKQPQSSPEGEIRFERESRCLACHAGTSALKVPGGLVRALLTDAEGNTLSGYSRVTHDMPFEKRFGGWYVTGKHGRMPHRGNRIDPRAGTPLMETPDNLKDLSTVLDPADRYLTAHSDLVAQMVLHHQVHGQNLLIRVHHEARLGRRSDAEEQLVRYLLFADEAPLSEPIQGSTGFAKWFEKRGKQDARGRSLREFDLKTRLFKYRLSYLIETPLFDALPAEVKQRIYQKLWEVLSAENSAPPFDHLSKAERRAILEIVSELKVDLPRQWAKLRKAPALRH